MMNNMRYRGLFAVQVALLPLIIAFNLLVDEWAMVIPLGLLVVCRLIMAFVKNRASLSEHIIQAIGDALTLGFIGIYFAYLGYIPTWLAVVDCVLVVLYEIANAYFFCKPMPDFIDALDFCFVAFIFITLISLTFVFKIDAVAKVSFLAIMITSAIVVAYKVYRFFNYYIINRKSKFAKSQDKANKKG